MLSAIELSRFVVFCVVAPVRRDVATVDAPPRADLTSLVLMATEPTPVVTPP